MPNETEGQCCPEFHPEVWDKKEVSWEGKLFVKDSVRQIFHIPLGFGKKVTTLMKAIEVAGAGLPPEEYLLLSYDPSPWKSELYLSVAKEVPGLENVRLSGNYFAKVYDGPFQNVPRWLKATDEYVRSVGKTVKKHYFFYTTCPKCAKKYGHNYVVDFAQV